MAKFTEFNLLDEAFIDTDLQIPDFNKLKQDRQQRNATILKEFEINEHESSISVIENNAAMKIQRLFRGFLGRKKYVDVLYESVLVGEENLLKKQQQQVQDGEILIENYRIERELEETDSVSRNRTRLFNANAAIIQRAWREHKNVFPKDHICCACEDDYPDLYDYYSRTETICFCCEKHRDMTNKQRMSLDLSKEELDFNEDTTLSTAVSSQASVEWSSISSVLNSGHHTKRVSNSIGMPDIRNKIETNQDVNLMSINDCESDDVNNNNINNDYDDIEIGISPSIKDLDMDIANTYITHYHLNKNSKTQGPLEESTQALESLTIHKEHQELQENIDVLKQTEEVRFNAKSINELKKMVQNLQNDIAEKNLELLKELMVRDDLYTTHEALLMDADNLSRNATQIRKT